MKINGHLIMRNSRGAKCCLTFNFEAEFIPLDQKDSIKVTVADVPLQLNDIFIASDNWTFRLPLQDDQGFGMVTAWKMPA